MLSATFAVHQLHPSLAPELGIRVVAEREHVHAFALEEAQDPPPPRQPEVAEEDDVDVALPPEQPAVDGW